MSVAFCCEHFCCTGHPSYSPTVTCAVQLPMAAAFAAPDLLQQQADAHAVGDTAAEDSTSLPPELPSAVPQPANCSGPSWTEDQNREMSSKQPAGLQQCSPVTAAASGCVLSPAAMPPAQRMTSGLCSPGHHALPESAAHVIQDISGSHWGQCSEQDAAIVCSPDQNLGCMPPPSSGQKLRRLQQKQNSSPEDSCSSPPWQVQHSGRLTVDSLPSRAPSRESVLSFEALATRSHTSGLDLSTVCWLISGHPD